MAKLEMIKLPDNFPIGKRSWTQFDVLNKAMANLEQRIADGIADGSLTQAEADIGKVDLTRLVDKIQRHSTDGEISEDEYTADLRSIRLVSDEIVSLRHNSQGGKATQFTATSTMRQVIKAAIANLRGRIEEGRQDGSLTPAETKFLSEKLADLEAKFKDQKQDGFHHYEYDTDLAAIAQLSRDVYSSTHNCDNQFFD